jgi:hypothetical protein
MADITRNATGLYRTAAEWDLGIIPGTADRAFTSTFTVTLDDARTLGDGSAVATDAIDTSKVLDIGTTGKLVISATGQLTLQGNAKINNVGFAAVNNAIELDGGKLSFNSATQEYRLLNGHTNANRRRIYGRNGFTIESLGAGHGFINAGTGGNGNQLDLDGGFLTNLGTASQAAITAFTDSTATDSLISLKNLKISGCGTMTLTSSTGQDLIVEGCAAVDGAATYDLTTSILTVPNSGRVRRIVNNGFEKGWSSNGVQQAVVTDNVFRAYSISVGTLASMATEWARNVHDCPPTNVTGILPAALVEDEYITVGFTTTNEHIIGLSTFVASTFRNSIIDPENDYANAGEGEYVTAGTANAQGGHVVEGNLFLPHPGPTGVAGIGDRWLELLGAIGFSVDMRHNSGAGAFGVVGYNHANSTSLSAGAVKFRGNLAIGLATNSDATGVEQPGSNFKLVHNVGGTANPDSNYTDFMRASESIKNGTYRVKPDTTYPGTGWGTVALSAPEAAVVGAQDIHDNPFSVDYATFLANMPRMSTFGSQVLGLSGTRQQLVNGAYRRMVLVKGGWTAHADYHASATRANLVSHVRTYWTPTTASYYASPGFASGRNTIGAVEMAAPGGGGGFTPPTSSRRKRAVIAAAAAVRMRRAS